MLPTHTRTLPWNYAAHLHAADAERAVDDVHTPLAQQQHVACAIRLPGHLTRPTQECLISSGADAAKVCDQNNARTNCTTEILVTM